ncbi:hypothetical protein V6N13_023987 [Hibiscus sabdariffa]
MSNILLKVSVVWVKWQSVSTQLKNSNAVSSRRSSKRASRGRFRGRHWVGLGGDLRTESRNGKWRLGLQSEKQRKRVDELVKAEQRR